MIARLPSGAVRQLAPTAAFYAVCFGIPLAILFVLSFWTQQGFERVPDLTLRNYLEGLTNRLYLAVFLRTVVVGLVTAAVVVPVAYLLAYLMRFVFERWAQLLLGLVLISLFSGYLVRIYAWRTVLGSRGLINSALERAGLIDEPLGFLLYSRFAVVVALVHIFLPYVVLVLFAGMGPVSEGLLESARDLGANASLLWRRVLLPIMAAPAFSAFVFVFILSSADYVTPQFLGGKDGVTLGVQIQQNFIAVGNWPLAAATSFLMLLAFVAVYAIGSFALRRLRLHDIRLES